MAKKEAGKCIFDGNGNLSKEHFYPNWASELMPKHPANQYIETLHTFIKQKQRVGAPEVNTRNGQVNTKKLRVVCKTCNETWMSVLETLAKPILTPLIKGNTSVISSDEALILARWVTLKIMVAEHSKPSEAVITEEARRQFKATLELPANIRIWLGRCGQDGWESAYIRHAATVSMTPNPSFPLHSGKHQIKNIHSITFGIGELLVHVAHTTLEGLELEISPTLSEVLLPIYPFDKSIQWPPRRLDTAEANFVSQLLDQMLKQHNVRWRPIPTSA